MVFRSFRFCFEPHAGFLALRQAFGPRRMIRCEDVEGIHLEQLEPEAG